MRAATSLARSLAPGRALARDFAHNFGRDFAHCLALVLDRAHTRDTANARDTALGIVLRFDSEEVVEAIKRGAYAEAQRLAANMMDDSYVPRARLGILLSDLLAVAAAESPIEMRAGQRRYAACIFEYAYDGYEILEDEDRSWWRRWIGIRGKTGLRDSKQAALQAYWWLQIVRLREEGKLDAWEGIRIVREQVDS